MVSLLGLALTALSELVLLTLHGWEKLSIRITYILGLSAPIVVYATGRQVNALVFQDTKELLVSVLHVTVITVELVTQKKCSLRELNGSIRPLGTR